MASKVVGVTGLPKDMIDQAFGFLNLSDLDRCKQVCHVFNRVAANSMPIKKERERLIVMEGQAALASYGDFFPSCGGVF